MIIPKKLVAILDNNLTDAQESVTWLEMQFDVLVVRNGEELVRQLDSREIDLLMLSSELTENYSLAIMAEIRSKQPELPIVLMFSGAGHSSPMSEHYRKLAKATLSKPFSEQVMLDLVQSVLKNSSGSQPAHKQRL